MLELRILHVIASEVFSLLWIYLNFEKGPLQ